ncbi:response regulator transcription factor [Portibacter lacus]|uniref:DNA-binding response regulator n=1 Tax=Portibacter lacus TaxID=1099794 RepID=A0AA37WDL8_9BACT|nr:response regulator transcription factor [Portibacter lacus]GLR18041.1 DNA-binding response regulator [Portibacter lacus]
MSTKARIFYVEDDETLGFVTKDNLELSGFEVVHFTHGNEAILNFKPTEYDLCLLDVMLPGIDGFELARRIRKISLQIPIIFLTAKSMKEDRIEGLLLGGDDYITKPFSIEELILKINVFLRRKEIVGSVEKSEFVIGQYTLDYKNLVLSSSNSKKSLTLKEAELLKYLIKNKNEVIKRADILVAVWGKDDYFLGRSLDVFISRLRKYLKDDSSIEISNRHGVGFVFKVES